MLTPRWLRNKLSVANSSIGGHITIYIHLKNKFQTITHRPLCQNDQSGAHWCQITTQITTSAIRILILFRMGHSRP